MKARFTIAVLTLAVVAAGCAFHTTASHKTPAAPPIQVALGDSKKVVHELLGMPDFSILGGRLGDESETYYALGLNLSYRDNQVAVMTVKHFEPPPGFVFSKPDKRDQTTVTVNK